MRSKSENLSGLANTPASPNPLDEKLAFSDTTVEKQRSPDSNKGSQTEDRDYASDRDVQYVNGEPVVTTGRDVSRFLVDTRDDGDPALTFRSLVLGTAFAGLGAALFQIYIFKPIQMTVSTVFLLLLIYSAGFIWSKYVPRASWVEGTRFAQLGPALNFLNPGEFRIKEVHRESISRLTMA